MCVFLSLSLSLGASLEVGILLVFVKHGSERVTERLLS